MAGTFANGVAPAGAAFSDALFGTGSDATVVPTAAATAVYTMASAPGAGAAFNITYTLGGGAVWGAALTSGSCAYGDTDAGGNVCTVALVSGGGTDDATATFRVDVAGGGADAGIEVGDTYTLTYDINKASALGTAPATITLGIALADTLGAVDTAGSVNAFTSLDGTTETGAASAAAGTLNIDVATGNTLFTGTSADILSLGTGTNNAVILGNVSLTDNVTPAREDDGTTAWALAGGDALGSVTLTVTGDFSASLAVDQDTNSATADGVFLDLNASGTFNAGEQATTLTATTATFNLGGIAAAILTAHNIVMVVDGATEIAEQTPTAVLAIDWTTATYKDEQSATITLRQLQRNGVTRYVYNIPGSSNADAAFIRVTNTSGISGMVRGTMYDQTGALIGTALTTLADADHTMPQASMSTYIYNAAALEALFGTWTGRARLVINAELSSMEVMALIRSSTGTITNMGPMAPTSTP